MARVEAVVEEIEMIGDHGGPVPGLSISCPICDHEVEVYGTGDSSARRGGATLAEECPRGLRNFYVCVIDDGESYGEPWNEPGFVPNSDAYPRFMPEQKSKPKTCRRSWKGFYGKR